MDRTDGDNYWIQRIVFPAYDGLPVVDYFRGEYDRVFRLVRIRAVPTHPSDVDVDCIDVRSCITFSHADAAGFQIGFVVESQSEIRLAEFFIETVFEQRTCPSTQLLCWLPNEHDRAVPLIL